MNGSNRSARKLFVLDKNTQQANDPVNTVGKFMNPTILTPAIGKIDGQTGFFNLGMVTGLGKRKLWS